VLDGLCEEVAISMTVSIALSSASRFGMVDVPMRQNPA
jgi:hypothetical protein